MQWQWNFLYANKTEICKFKTHDEIPWYDFCLGSISKDFTKDTWYGTVYIFLFDHSAAGKEDIANIHEYLIKKYNMKCLDLVSNRLLCYWVLVEH